MDPRPAMVRRQRSEPVPKPLKIVVTGPFAAGKTTFIQTISEIAIVGTERDVTDDTKATKERTTVAMDFGRITFAEGLALYLFGTPGQRRFEMMWEILSEGMIGFVLMVPAHRTTSVDEAWHILNTFRTYADVPSVVGVSHLDQVDEPPDVVFLRMRELLDLDGSTPIMECDPRKREHVKAVLLQVLFGVMDRLDQTPAVAT